MFGEVTRASGAARAVRAVGRRQRLVAGATNGQLPYSHLD